MTAGLPGFGLSGVFFVISALLMVPLELVATVRGRSSLARWGSVLRSAAIALAILVGVELTYAALRLAVTALSGSPIAARHGSAHPGGGATSTVGALPVLPILGTLALMVIIAAAAKAAEIWCAQRPRRDPVDSQPSRGPAHPQAVGHERRAAEPRHPLELASTRSR